ncbi:hypothetical protein F511_46798 [Dorcoceras hygrometricum]|uniref:Uncharacterized protein n=1 Tax=Dorcoceras hygrometricum TaxID=472368 RepID=A0A2Z6ZSJ4_9LAMI|nr:hypothetical protein F511_46798 [Dorcoceras hygrometricum]
MKVAKYARQFSSLLSYDSHIDSQERTKRNKFMEGLRSDLLPLVLAGAPVTYADTMNRPIDIEKGLLNMQAQAQPPARQGFYPAPSGMPSSHRTTVFELSEVQAERETIHEDWFEFFWFG